MTAPALLFDSIPDDLKRRDQWVGWRWEQRPDKTTGELKWTKPPYQTNGKLASSTRACSHKAECIEDECK